MSAKKKPVFLTKALNVSWWWEQLVVATAWLRRRPVALIGVPPLSEKWAPASHSEARSSVDPPTGRSRGESVRH